MHLIIQWLKKELVERGQEKFWDFQPDTSQSQYQKQELIYYFILEKGNPYIYPKMVSREEAHTLAWQASAVYNLY